MAEQLTEQQREDRWYQIIGMAWSDPSFKQQLLTNPKPIFDEYGYNVPGNVNIRVIEQGTPEAARVGGAYQVADERGMQTLVLQLPQVPADLQPGELSEEELEGVAGGMSQTVGGGAVATHLAASDINCCCCIASCCTA